MYQVVKRDGKVTEFEISKISMAITKAFEALGKQYHPSVIDMLALRVTAEYEPLIRDGKITVETIQDCVEKVLSEAGYSDVAKAYILYRKQREKVYMRDVFHVTVNSITTRFQQTLYLDGLDAKLMEGKRILIVDDVISTGESLKALEVLVEKAGGIICGRMAILAEGDAQGREDLVYLEKLPLFNPDGTVME